MALLPISTETERELTARLTPQERKEKEDAWWKLAVSLERADKSPFADRMQGAPRRKKP